MDFITFFDHVGLPSTILVSLALFVWRGLWPFAKVQITFGQQDRMNERNQFTQTINAQRESFMETLNMQRMDFGDLLNKQRTDFLTTLNQQQH